MLSSGCVVVIFVGFCSFVIVLWLFALDKTGWIGCVFFLLAFSQKGNSSHSPPRKRLIWGHGLISFSFVCGSSCCYCCYCGCCCLSICFCGPYFPFSYGCFYYASLLLHIMIVILLLVAEFWFLLCWFSRFSSCKVLFFLFHFMSSFMS